MKNCLVISDLNYLEYFGKSNILGGYVYTDSYASSEATADYSSAESGAIAIGENTNTYTESETAEYSWGYLEYSSAEATASAYAQTGSYTSLSWSNHSSHYYGLNFG